jgi:solute carrier family 35, member F5
MATMTTTTTTTPQQPQEEEPQQRPPPLLLSDAGYLRGLIFIVLVAIIWAASSVFVQFLYSSPTDDENGNSGGTTGGGGGFSFNSPFLLTYIGTSLFTLWIPIKLVASASSSSSSSQTPPTASSSQSPSQQRAHTQRRRRRTRTKLQRPVETATSAAVDDISSYSTTYQNVPSLPIDDESSLHDNDEQQQQQQQQHDDEDHDDDNIEMDDEDDGEIMDEDGGIQLYHHRRHHHHATRTDAALDNSSSSSNNNDDSSSGSLNASQRGLLSMTTAETAAADGLPTSSSSTVSLPWTTRQHVMTALQIAPIWFLANWSYNASLAYTSITSSTVLASTGSVFTFIFAVWSGDEVFNSLKLCGVLLGVLGCLLTAWHDASSNSSSSSSLTCVNATQLFCNDTSSTAIINTANGTSGASSNNNNNNNNLSLLGDCLGLLSAVGYGMYAVQTRVLCPHNEDLYSMELLLGFIGLINAIALSPVAIYSYFHLTKHNDHGDSSNNGLTWVVLGCLVLKGLLDNALSDYLWLRGVILTSATVATVGLGLTIPLAFLSDLYLSFTGSSPSVLSLTSIVGAVAVLMGFVLVNVGMNQENNETHVLVGVEDSDNDDDDDNGNEPLGYIDNHHHYSDAPNDLILEQGHRNDDTTGSHPTRPDLV